MLLHARVIGQPIDSQFGWHLEPGLRWLTEFQGYVSILVGYDATPEPVANYEAFGHDPRLINWTQ